MATIKAKLESLNIMEKNVSVRFIVGENKAPAPPLPNERMANTVVVISSNEEPNIKELSALKPGKEYSITIS